MKLLTEITESVEPLITEEAGVKQYTIHGTFLQSDMKNRNGRIYPYEILRREVDRYTKEYINEKRALGELNHPDSVTINLDRVSHLITELTPVGKDFIGKARILDTPNGQIVRALIDAGVKLGVSSRGVGSLKHVADGDIVGEDYFLATAGDIVSDPSAPNAFVQGIRESKEWVWQNGVLTEVQMAAISKQASKPSVSAVTRRMNEAKAWEMFIRNIRVAVTS